MDETGSEPVATGNRTQVERRSERALAVTRVFDAPVHIVFEAWSKAELFRTWWAPKSSPVPLLSCEMDVRTGGTYRLQFGQDAANAMSFFGKYIEVVQDKLIVWTNDEQDAGALTTVTFEDLGDKTKVVYLEVYASKEALDEAQDGMADGMSEQFGQLDAFLAARGAGA